MNVRFPAGQFSKGDYVLLKHPEDHMGFEHPEAALEVAALHWFRMYQPPTYALREPGSDMCVTPFVDADLIRAEVSPNAELCGGPSGPSERAPSYASAPDTEE